MTEKLPRLTASEIIRALEKSGFSLSRQSGSHKIYKNSTGNRVTVPYHSGKILHPKIMRNILRDMGLTVEELKELL
jgi:predicted RNA binding protein YcfA (HicA-like mRNA interferase family)